MARVPLPGAPARRRGPGPHQALALQRLVGNRTTGRLLARQPTPAGAETKAESGANVTIRFAGNDARTVSFQALSFSLGGTGALGEQGTMRGRESAQKTAALNKYLDKASATLVKAVARGEPIAEVVIVVRFPDGGGYRITLTDVYLTGYSTTGHEGRSVESLGLDYGEIEWKFTPSASPPTGGVPVPYPTGG